MLIDHIYDAQQDIHWYHTGYSTDPVYHQFYKWLRLIPLHYKYSDMPHHNFVLLHETDRLAMHARFADSLTPMQAGTFHRDDYVDLTAPLDPNSPEVILAGALRDAIQEEIDKDIMTLLWSKTP